MKGRKRLTCHLFPSFAVKVMVDPRTQEKISILGTDFHEELFKYVAPENVPKEFGGSDPTPLGESPEEHALRAVADACNGGPGASFARSLEAAARAGDSEALLVVPPQHIVGKSKWGQVVQVVDVAAPVAVDMTVSVAPASPGSAGGGFGGAAVVSVMEVVDVDDDPPPTDAQSAAEEPVSTVADVHSAAILVGVEKRGSSSPPAPSATPEETTGPTTTATSSTES